MRYYLRVGNDTLEDRLSVFSTKKAAVDEYRAIVEEIMSFGNQPPGASIHMAETKRDLVEYPDFILSVGARGGIVCWAAS